MNNFSSPYVKLAIDSVRFYLDHHQVLPCPGNLNGELKMRAGAFVSIKKKKQLRGCIGTMMPKEENLAKEIIENAVKAACRDPRFDPVSQDEFQDLTFSVDILSPLEKVEDLSTLNPKQYGLMVKSHSKQGVLLPDLDEVETVADQIRICRAKGKIRDDDPQEYFRFQVHRFA